MFSHHSLSLYSSFSHSLFSFLLLINEDSQILFLPKIDCHNWGIFSMPYFTSVFTASISSCVIPNSDNNFRFIDSVSITYINSGTLLLSYFSFLFLLRLLLLYFLPEESFSLVSFTYIFTFYFTFRIL